MSGSPIKLVKKHHYFYEIRSKTMRKVIATINMTLDGYCDHTAVTADDEIHQHYTGLLRNSDTMLFGRITYQLMEDYWPAVAKNPTGNKSDDDFAAVIDGLSKVVFSSTLKDIEWESARLAKRGLEEEVLALRQQPGKDILIGSRSLIIALMNLNLIDELQLTVHPVLAGKGLPLFENINDGMILKLKKTKTFTAGAVTFYYEPAKASAS
jgi:dihydrofolate reductase